MCFTLRIIANVCKSRENKLQKKTETDESLYLQIFKCVHIKSYHIHQLKTNDLIESTEDLTQIFR